MVAKRRYGIVCCAGKALAYLDVTSGAVKLAPAGDLHMHIAVNPRGDDGNLTWAPEQLHSMTTTAAAERQVTEIVWRDHRSWVIRCGHESCTQQAEVSSVSLRRLGHLLALRECPVVDGVHVLTLRVLNFTMTHTSG